ncbi:Sulfotransferase 1C4, partial [Armadillidium vulgare]
SSYQLYSIDYGFAVSTATKFNPEGDLVKRFKKLCPGKDYNKGLHIQTAAALPDPRLLKGHRPLSFWPPNILDKAKVIYLARDPRDVLVSCYHFFQTSEMTKSTATLDEYVDDFMDSIVISAYWEHVRLAWEKRNNPNFLFLFYEDLKENPNEQIKKVDQFIGTNRSQSKAGSWKEDLPLHLQEKMNNWMKINLLQFSEDFKYKKEQFS